MGQAVVTVSGSGPIHWLATSEEFDKGSFAAGWRSRSGRFPLPWNAVISCFWAET